jgi:hypothetical protein
MADDTADYLITMAARLVIIAFEAGEALAFVFVTVDHLCALMCEWCTALATWFLHLMIISIKYNMISI